MRCLAGGNEFVGDPFRLIDGNREAKTDRTRLPPDELPTLAIAELIPISCALAFTNAPPEFPGFIGASVWMASIAVAWFAESATTLDTGRSSALMMPLVTVPSKPNGDPTATTPWPTRSVAR